MDVMLLEDVFSLGRAGDIKTVANGYGRNYLIPQGLATRATPDAVAQAERIAEEANKRRDVLNQELASVAEQIGDVQLLFAARAGETGKLYGSVTTAMIAEQLTEKIGVEVNKRQIHAQPLRLLGMHTVAVRLTIDLIPEFSVVIYREGESPENYMVAAQELAAEAEEAYAAAHPEEAAGEEQLEAAAPEGEEAPEEASSEEA
jgi:large subunit ribosomal protein L9